MEWWVIIQKKKNNKKYLFIVKLWNYMWICILYDMINLK